MLWEKLTATRGRFPVPGGATVELPLLPEAELPHLLALAERAEHAGETAVRWQCRAELLAMLRRTLPPETGVNLERLTLPEALELAAELGFLLNGVPVREETPVPWSDEELAAAEKRFRRHALTRSAKRSPENPRRAAAARPGRAAKASGRPIHP